MTDTAAPEVVEVTLLPCPFCGGAGFVEGPALGCDWHVYCDDCGASGADCQSEAQAITAWNTRQAFSPAAGEVERENVVTLPRRAAQALLDDLNARINGAHITAVPVFAGIVELHDALAALTPTNHEARS